MSAQLGQGSYSRDFATNAATTGGKSGYPRFFLQMEKDEAASIAQNRPIAYEVEMVEIIIPSIAQYNKPVRIVRQEDKDRWPKEYAAFKAGMEIPVDGTPLEDWNVLNKSSLFELKSLGFRTIEDIAEMTDYGIQRLGMLGRPLKMKAAAYLDDSERTRVANSAIEQSEKLAMMNADKDAKILNLQEQLDNLGRQLHAMVAQRSEPLPAHLTGPIPPTQVEPERRSALSSLALSPIARKDAQRRELAAFDEVGPSVAPNVENAVTKRRPGRPRRVAEGAAA